MTLLNHAEYSPEEKLFAANVQQFRPGKIILRIGDRYVSVWTLVRVFAAGALCWAGLIAIAVLIAALRGA